MNSEKNPSSFYDDSYLACRMSPLSDAIRGEDNGLHYASAVLSGRIASRFGITRILEIGCGPGYVVRHLRNLGFHADGLEYGKAALEGSVCKAKFGDLTDSLPCQDASYGLVFALGVLSHVPEEQISHALSELYRVSGKLLWTNTLIRYHETQKHHRTFREPSWWRERFRKAGWHERADLSSMLQEAGLNQDDYQWSSVWDKEPSPKGGFVKFTISVAVHNLVEITQKCIESIFKHSSDFELIVTDNASTDGTKDYLSSLSGFQNVQVVANLKNLGFGAPHNHALTLAKGAYFIVLNNDLEVVPGWLEGMEKKFIGNPKVAVAGVRGGCTGLSPEGVGFPSPKLEYIEGSCLMIKTDLARRHGLFSPYLKFAYYEDSDLSLRMRELGYEIAVASDIQILHLGSRTSNLVKNTVDLQGYYIRNSAVFKARWRKYLAERSFVQRILVMRASATGDAFLVTPVFRALRKKWPCSEITFVTGFPEPIRGNPYLHRLETVQSQPREAFDLIFDLNLAYERRPMMHIVDAYCEAAGVSVDGYRPDIYPNAEEERWAKATLPSNRPVVVVNPGPTAWVGRNWTNEKFCKVAEHFKAKGFYVVLSGFQGSNAVLCDGDLRSRTTVHQLASLLKKSALYVGIDSFPMHLAVSVDIPIAAVFGCIDPSYRLPPNTPYMRGVTAPGVGCLGCHHYLPAPRTSTGCLRDRVYCMEKLEPSHVIEQAEIALLEYKKAKNA